MNCNHQNQILKASLYHWSHHPLLLPHESARKPRSPTPVELEHPEVVSFEYNRVFRRGISRGDPEVDIEFRPHRLEVFVSQSPGAPSHTLPHPFDFATLGDIPLIP